MTMRNAISSYALKICIPYALIGGVWILLSDRLLSWAVDDADTLTVLQTYKGWLFVILSAVLVYLLSRHHISRFGGAEARLQESQDALSESQRALVTLTGNLPGMTYRCRNDPDWTMEFVSEGCLALTEYSPEEILNNNAISYGELIFPGDRDEVWERVQQGIDNRNTFPLEYRIRTKSGRVKWVWEQGCGVFSEDGDLLALEGYIFDISERKELEEKLRESERLSHIGQAASTIIHDLKNPMQVILGHIELMRTNKRSPAYGKTCVVVERQVQRMLSMSRELLEFARGKISLELAPTDITELLEQIADTYGPIFSQEGVSLSHTWRKEAEASCLLTIDRERIWRVLMNLVSNAKEALTGGGQIRIRSMIGYDQVSIEVQDDGPGVPDSIRTTLFEPFVSHGKSHGTGLGLAIAKRIVEAHQGTISFVSDVGSGSTFIVTLPRLTIDSPAKRLAEVESMAG